ncbi:egg cell-secreted protein 1.1-like [Lolium rigidum]|uniref:egg cell-secreted protein 1.1-like n=1 Tax=Lolium rigidum TaxID=89674 RepID=UPI001F5D3161|nr:egg cell-secreted protein 1.1-like [Lolium rigidum]
MASSRALLPALLLLLAAATASAAGARPATTTTAVTFVRFAPAPSLAERLEGEGPQQCWESLMDIKSCTGEIILFFLNGEAYLGPGCCRAIRVIEQRCWAADAMLTVIGFTPEEGDMLKGYCDAGDDDDTGGDGHHHSIGGSSAPPPSGVLDDVARDVTVAASAAAAAGRKGRLGAQLDG